MPALKSAFDPGSDAAGVNREAMLAHLDAVEELLARARAGGGERYVERHRQRGKLPARERIELLLDRDAPFLELMPLAAAESDFHPGASIVCGIGVIEGVECVISANDPTVRGGTLNPYGFRKVVRGQEIALENRLPYISLVESGGAERSAELLDVNPAPLIDKDLFPLRPACEADDEPDKQPQAAGKETEDAMDDVVDRLPPKQGCLISAVTFETDAFKARVQNRLVDLMLEKTPTLLVGHSRALRSRKVSTRH